MLRVALVGRPNVGKSSLFNRLAGQRLAIVEDTPGVTRDRHTAHICLGEKFLTLIDTGGFLSQAQGLEAQIAQQIRFAVEEADLILWVVDARTGLLSDDLALEEWLRKHRSPEKPLWLIVNKADNPQHEVAATEAFRLGIEPVFFVSAANGRGLAALRAALIQLLETQSADTLPAEGPRFAIIGRPNVGKSSLLNALSRQTRAIVSDLPGTTRDPLYLPATWKGRPFFWVDTAGLRRKSHIPPHSLERYAALRSLEALQRADVVLLTLNAQEALTAQDFSLLRLTEKYGKGLVLLLHRADLIEKARRADLEARIAQKLLPLEAVPILWTSAITGEGLEKVPEAAFTVYEAGQYRIPTRQLNDTLLPILRNHPHPMVGTFRPAVKFLRQTGIRPPTFQLHVRHKDRIRSAYLHFIARQIRKHLFSFPGWLLRMRVIEDES